MNNNSPSAELRKSIACGLSSRDNKAIQVGSLGHMSGSNYSVSIISINFGSIGHHAKRVSAIVGVKIATQNGYVRHPVTLVPARLNACESTVQGDIIQE